MNALQIAASGMSAQQMRVDVVANNLANMSTTGFNPRRADQVGDPSRPLLIRAGARAVGQPDALEPHTAREPIAQALGYPSRAPLSDGRAHRSDGPEASHRRKRAQEPPGDALER